MRRLSDQFPRLCPCHNKLLQKSTYYLHCARYDKEQLAQSKVKAMEDYAAQLLNPGPAPGNVHSEDENKQEAVQPDVQDDFEENEELEYDGWVSPDEEADHSDAAVEHAGPEEEDSDDAGPKQAAAAAGDRPQGQQRECGSAPPLGPDADVFDLVQILCAIQSGTKATRTTMKHVYTLLAVMCPDVQVTLVCVIMHASCTHNVPSQFHCISRA